MEEIERLKAQRHAIELELRAAENRLFCEPSNVHAKFVELAKAAGGIHDAEMMTLSELSDKLLLEIKRLHKSYMDELWNQHKR